MGYSLIDSPFAPYTYASDNPIGFAGGPGYGIGADVGLWIQNTWTYTLPSAKSIGSTIGGLLGGIGGRLAGGWLGRHVNPVGSLVQSLGWGKQKSEQVLQEAASVAASNGSSPTSLAPCTTGGGPSGVALA